MTPKPLSTDTEITDAEIAELRPLVELLSPAAQTLLRLLIAKKERAS